MKNRVLSFTALSLLILMSCSVDLNASNGIDGVSSLVNLSTGETIVASKVVAEEQRKLSSFDGLDISSAIKVNIIDNDYKGQITVSAPDNILPKIVTKVEQGTLKVYIDGSVQMSNGENIVVTVPHQKLRNIAVAGASAVYVKHQLKVESMKLNASGASKIELNILTNDLKSEASGASKLVLEGNAQKVTMNISGASKVVAEDLKTASLFIDATGASKASVWAVNQLKVSASGASKVEYKAQNNLSTNLDTSGASKISEK